MDISSEEWFSDLANEDPETMMEQCQMMMSSIMEDDEFKDIFQPLDINFNSNNSALITNNSALIKSEAKITPNTHSTSDWSSLGQLISFGSSEFETNMPKPKKGVIHRSKRVAGSTCTEEHVVAERRRREKMNLGFVALHALIPGLKKTDKASIVAETTEYIKQLERRAKLLEEQTTMTTVESVYVVKNTRSQPVNDANNSSNEDYFNKTINPDDLLEIDAKILNNNVLIRIHSLKKQGLIQTILEEIRRLNITTLNCQTMPFGSYALDLTIVAQVNDDFRMTTEDVVNCLEKTLKHTIALDV